jgi:hypothetical protein
MENFNKGDVVYYIQNNEVYAGIIIDVGICTLTVNNLIIDKPFVFTDRKEAELSCLHSKASCFTKTLVNLYHDIVDRNTAIINLTGMIPEGVSSNTFPFEGQVICGGKFMCYKQITIKRDETSKYGYNVVFNGEDDDLWISWNDNYIYNIDVILELNKHLERHLHEMVV